MNAEQSAAVADSAEIAAPICDIDLYSDEVMGDLYPYVKSMRDLAPVVWLSKYHVYYATSYEAVLRGLSAPRGLSSVGGIGLRDMSLSGLPARATLVGADPPNHTRHREIILRVLSPTAISKLESLMETAASRTIDQLLERGSVDMVADIIRPFTVSVLGDAVGIPRENRGHLAVLGDMILASVGPANRRYELAVRDAVQGGSIDWAQRMSRREMLAPQSIGADIYATVDNGLITEDEAADLVSMFLFGALDTTIYSFTNGVRNFLDHPDQWHLLRNDPSLVRGAFEEVLRYNVPVQQMYRNITMTMSLDGVRVEQGRRIGFSIAAANRDPKRFAEPDRFDIRRKTLGHLGFGAGIHACVGQMVAKMEARAFFGCLARRVEALEWTGTPQRLVTGGLASVHGLPVMARPSVSASP